MLGRLEAGGFEGLGVCEVGKGRPETIRVEEAYDAWLDDAVKDGLVETVAVGMILHLIGIDTI
jgi:hypothetical protein